MCSGIKKTRERMKNRVAKVVRNLRRTRVGTLVGKEVPQEQEKSPLTTNLWFYIRELPE